jgi:hypothetical protein
LTSRNIVRGGYETPLGEEVITLAIWRSSLRQTAANDASSIVVAELGVGLLETQEEVNARFKELTESIFADLDTIAAGDDAQYEGTDAKPARKSTASKRTSSKSKTGGSRSKGGKSISLSDALNMELTGGAFEGETLETVLNMDADQCDADFDYGDGERSGRDYITWLASDKNPNPYTQVRARVIADDENLDY